MKNMSKYDEIATLVDELVGLTYNTGYDAGKGNQDKKDIAYRNELKKKLLKLIKEEMP